jgi:plasmid stabilization system protein ParE
VKNRKVIWSEKAKSSLKKHCDHIKKDSKTAAKIVRKELINASKTLNNHPEKYQVDEFYPSNSGNIRRFFRWSYRIIYQINENTIDILNVLHASQEPSEK